MSLTGRGLPILAAPQVVGYLGYSCRASKVAAAAAHGRVEMWRGMYRPDISVSAPFVWRCLSDSTVTPS